LIHLSHTSVGNEALVMAQRKSTLPRDVVKTAGCAWFRNDESAPA
jgi:hypothetical protein